MQASQKYSNSEISLHTTKKDCWLVIHGKVYDVSTFLEDHPGGDEVLLQAAGGDATEAFEDIGHSTTATSMMEGYRIGSAESYVSSADSTGSGKATRTKPRTSFQTQQQPLNSAGLTDFLLPLLVLGLACGAWYYLTFVNVNA